VSLIVIYTLWAGLPGRGPPEGRREGLYVRDGIVLQCHIMAKDIRLAQEIRRVRLALGLDVPEFASKFAVSPRTVENWEQGHRTPDPRGQRTLAALKAQVQQELAERSAVSYSTKPPEAARGAINVDSAQLAGTPPTRGSKSSKSTRLAAKGTV
jgi:DNA-binding transcriptional regulator YiaG